MKSIENKETKIINADEKGNPLGNSHYADLIHLCIRRGKQGGFDWNDIENRLAISNALKSANETIELEDANYTYLKKLVETMGWGFFHEDLLTFKTDVLAAK